MPKPTEDNTPIRGTKNPSRFDIQSLLIQSNPSLTTTSKHNSESTPKSSPFELRENDPMESSPSRSDVTTTKAPQNQVPVYPPHRLTYPSIPHGYGQHIALANLHFYSLWSAQAQQAQAGLFNWPALHHSNPVVSQTPSRLPPFQPSQNKPADETRNHSSEIQSNEDTNSSNSATESLLAASECHMAICKDEDGDTPLHIAIVHENKKLIQKLIGLISFSKLTVNTPNNLSQTALHLAVLTQQPQVVCQLMKAGADALMQDRNGQTSLHLCSEKGDVACLTEIMNLMQGKLNLEIKNFEGMTPLHLAVQKKRMEVIQVLVRYGANIDAKDGKSGHTPLHHGIDQEYIEILQFLVSKGANINEPNFSGITPLQSANSCRNDTISKIILSQETPNSSSATLTRPNVIQQNLASVAGHKATNSSSLHLPALNSKKRQENEKKRTSSHKRKTESPPNSSKRSRMETQKS